jgi:ubiquinone/menaquinone biosynthesis C-methylase UbiE
MTSDPKQVVRRGYDVLSMRYDEATGADSKYRGWINDLIARLEPGSRVLDIGCGSGVPVARELTAAGHHVTGVDISEVQIQRARELVPQAEFVNADAITLDFPPESFDAVVSLYALIHLPLIDQQQLLKNLAAWLKPGGWFLCTTGNREWTGTDENWLDGGVPMWWSHTDADTYRTWITQAGLTITNQQFVPEGSGGHALFWSHRPPHPLAQPPRPPRTGRTGRRGPQPRTCGTHQARTAPAGHAQTWAGDNLTMGW